VAGTASESAGPRPGELSATESELRTAFLAEVDKIPGGDRLRRCIQCGTCSGSCPVSYAMDIQPRQIVAYFRAGDLESILRSRTIWICASCYSCTVRCPSGIKVTDLIYGLKRMAIEREIRMRGLRIYTLSEQFVRLVNRFGRNSEPKLLFRYLIREAPFRLFRMLPLAWRLLRTGRVQWRTPRVQGIAGLRKIIAKAEEMEQLLPQERRFPTHDVGYGAVTERAAAARGEGAS
jgi:heterodisulfide reductase subunit C